MFLRHFLYCFSWNFWYNCDICDNRRVGCDCSICRWFTLHTRICRWFNLFFISWSPLWLQPRWVSFAPNVIFIFNNCSMFIIFLFFRVKRVTACGSKVGKMDIVGGPEVCVSVSHLTCALLNGFCVCLAYDLPWWWFPISAVNHNSMIILLNLLCSSVLQMVSKIMIEIKSLCSVFQSYGSLYGAPNHFTIFLYFMIWLPLSLVLLIVWPKVLILFSFEKNTALWFQSVTLISASEQPLSYSDTANSSASNANIICV